MHNKKKNFIAIPKDAASIIILRERKGKIYVLMGKRPENSRFMPGVYVFPGGVLERKDYLTKNIFNPDIDPHKHKLKTRNESHAIAIFYAAIRETFEETGLYLSQKAQHPVNPKFLDGIYRENLNKYSLIPDIKKLIFFGRAITPSFLKKRYHARFFLSLFENFNGNLKANGELENLSWINIYEAKNKNIADVTEFMIDQVISLKGNYKLSNNKFSYPMFTWRNKKRWIKWENL